MPAVRDFRSWKDRCRRPIWPRCSRARPTFSISRRRLGCARAGAATSAIYTDNNVDATQRLLEASVGRPLHRFVYASSSSVYGDNVSIPMREDALPQPVSPYGVTKLAAEQLCYLYHANYRVPTTSVRYFTVYGPRQRPDMAFHKFIRAALRGEADHALRRWRADTRLHLRDRRRRGDGRGRRPGWARAARTTSAAARASRSTNCSSSSAGFTAGRSRFGANPTRRATCAIRSPTRRRARADLGFSPQVSLEQGLEAEYHWLANTPALV